MPKTFPLLVALFLLLTLTSNAQQWGYVTLIAKQNANSVSLIDTNSAVVKQWTGLTGNTAYSSYMMEGGDLWRTVSASGASFSGGGIAGRVQKVSWNGTILFDYQVSTTQECSHHDICPLPNGNVLLIVYEKKTAAQVQQAGATANAIRWSEKIIELHPTGTTTAEIVWEWHLWDHLVQNLYPAKSNYQTSIVEHPELLNINYNNNATDWVHMNGIDYNATLNQIVVSSHNLNELWVIDHSTTTAQAATHAGGNSGRGGDLLYRWGNPAAYGATGSAVFNVVHDAHWVPEGCPRAGWLGGFNNRGVSNSVSAVDLFQAPWNGTSYTHTAGQPYTPATYGYRHPANGYSSNMGNSQQLPNGNTLVCLATASKVYEISPSGTQLWQYTSTGSIPQAWRYSRCYMESPKAAVVTANPTACAGGSVQLDITPSASGANTFTYNWSPATGLSSATVQDPVVSGISNDIVYTVTVTTAGGCSVTATVPVSIAVSPVANAGADVTIDPGQSTTLTASGGNTYAWNNGANTASIVVTPTSTTTYTVTVTNSNGCSDTDTVEVTVPGTNLTATASVSDSLLCLGESTQLNAVASGGSGNYTYTWSANGVFFSSLPNPVVSPISGTVYTVMIADGISTIEKTIAVLVAPQPLVNAGNDVTILTGSSTTLMATSTGGTYLWSTGETTASITVSPVTTAVYTVTLTNASGCSASDNVLVTVSAFLPLTASVSATDTVICYGDVTQLLVASNGGSGTYTYAWTSNPEGFTSTLPDPFINPEVPTTYTVVVSDGISQFVVSFEVLVNPLPQQPSIERVGETLVSSSTANNQWFYYGNPVMDASGQVYAPTQNGSYQVQIVDANGCYSPLSDPYEFIMTSTGQVLSEADWNIAPNPASTVVRILGDFDEMQFSIEIWNSTGGLALQTSGTKMIAVSELPSGAYLLRVNTPRGTGLRKLIILR